MPAYKDKKRNTWYVSFKIKDKITNEYITFKKRGFATKHDALMWESKEKVSYNINTSKVTFQELDLKYIEYKNAKPVTQQQEKYRVQEYMKDIKDIPMVKLSKAKILDWYTSLLKLDCSTSVKNYCIYLVKAVSRFGNEFYDLPNNASFLKRIQKKQSEYKEMDVWSIEEFNQFLSCVELPVYRLFYEFLYITGCRRGEAMALQYTDYHKGYININKSIKDYSNGFGDLKNNASKRKIRLPDVLISDLKPLLKQCNKNAPFIFGGERSLSTTMIQAYMDKAIKQSGVKRIRLHDLRHSFVTNAINNDCNIVAVSKYIGHSTIEQTLKTYTHLLEKTDEEMIEKIENLWTKNGLKK